jgi:hypothetical protein
MNLYLETPRIVLLRFEPEQAGLLNELYDDAHVNTCQPKSSGLADS